MPLTACRVHVLLGVGSRARVLRLAPDDLHHERLVEVLELVTHDDHTVVVLLHNELQAKLLEAN